MTDRLWRQSSYCANGGNNCVELAKNGDRIAIRESTDPAQVITTHPVGLRAFIRATKAGKFDRLPESQ
ncbi:DUF397 domain-containing protein [Streptomyces sp. B1866]|uniref:DUF397 domain-containing protein n=1 Tax=Streptomyces sp. B1866 TaxID=3075431 RepID=UPI00288E7BBF|nr:DUF397 domain-containing protein [Streptomyces sp. B1866]MDT3396949.1 DUF397 domain-containing protein [Streptomyces sp. B1866]